MKVKTIKVRQGTTDKFDCFVYKNWYALRTQFSAYQTKQKLENNDDVMNIEDIKTIVSPYPITSAEYFKSFIDGILSTKHNT